MPRSPSRSGSATPPRRARAPSPQRSQNKSPSPPRQEPEPAQQEPQQEPKLFITSLANEVTEDDLRSTFEPHGNIVNIFVKENERGKFAFVTYDTMEQANKGMQECNGKEIHDKAIRVGMAKPRAPKGQAGSRACFKCQQEGHMSRDCPNGGNNERKPRGPMVCRKCSKEGHIARNCPGVEEEVMVNETEEKPAETFKRKRSVSRSVSGSPKRNNRRSPSRQASPPRAQREEMIPEAQPEQPPKLFITSLASQVTEDDLRNTFEPHGNIVDISIKENDKGKFAFVTMDTMQEANKGMEECNGKEIHDKAIRVGMAKPRPPKGQAGSRACFKCQQEGHMSRDCPNGGNNERKPRGPMVCRKCSKEGHIARNCPGVEEEVMVNETEEKPAETFKRKRSVSRSVSGSPKRNKSVHNSPQRQQNMVSEQPQPEVKPQQPPKLFIQNLSQEVNEQDLRNTFEPHGNIVDLFVKENDRGKIAFVTFDTHDEAAKAQQECNGTQIKDQSIRVNFAKPRAPKNANQGQADNKDQRKPRVCFKCNQEGHFSRQCPNADARNDRRPPRRENNHMNRRTEMNAKDLIGKGYIFNPFSGEMTIFGKKGSREDYVCASEMECETSEVQNKRNNFGATNIVKNGSLSMDVELPLPTPKRKRGVSRSPSPKQVKAIPAQPVQPTQQPKADIKQQIKEGFKQATNVDKSRSRSRSKEKVVEKKKEVYIPKKRTPSEVSY